MATKVNPLERNLISLAGTMILLKKNRKLVESRPIIPKHMEGVMAPVKPSIDNILASFKQAEADTQKLAEDWIAQWMATFGVAIEGVYRLRHATQTSEVEFTGKVHAVRLVDKLVEQSWRAVELTLCPFDIQVISGWAPGSMSHSPQALFDRDDVTKLPHVLRDTKVVVHGREEPGLLLNVPIHLKDREDMARGYKERVIFQ